jgi:putrescine transport system substrate-binding protein
MAVRPSLRTIDSSQYVQALANGELCLAMGWSGDVVQARRRAREAGKDGNIEYVIPREGSVTAADVLAIPADAPHAANALAFIDYLLRPEVAARNVLAVSYASGVAGSVPLLPLDTRADPAIYPPAGVRARLTPMRAKSPEFTRALMRMWTVFKTG